MRIYIVQKDDTLYKIAKKHHVQLEDIIKLNPHIANPDYIVPGMKIKLPNQEDYKSDPGKVMGKTEREQGLNARTSERPFGPVTEMDDRGAGDMHHRVPLKRNAHFLNESRNESIDRLDKDEYNENSGKNRSASRDRKTYSNRQYVPLRESDRDRQRQMQRSSPMSYTDRDSYMNNQMGMPLAQQEQPYYCPCCMYHWHMQQSMMHHYNGNERPNPPQRRYY